jgi:uncharacterized protein
MARRGVRKAVAIAVGLSLAGCATLSVRSARRAAAGCHPAHKHLRAEDEATARAALPGVADVAFTTHDGLTLRGWYAPPAAGPAPRAVVVLVHGWGDNRVHWMPEMRLLTGNGFGVLAYDSRGSGESDGDLVTAGDREQEDVVAALDFVSARPDAAGAKIGLVGFSFGSSATALVAARDPRARAVVLDATWPSLEEEERAKTGKYGLLTSLPALWALRHEGVHLENVRVIDHIQEIHPRPILFVAGSDDDDTPVPVMHRVFDAAGTPKEMLVVRGAHHGDYADVPSSVYGPRVLAFFDDALRN